MDNVYKNYQTPVGGSALYLNLKKKGPVKVRLVSEPYIFNRPFTDPVSGETNISTKYGWVLYNFTDNMAQVIELPVTAYKAIANIASDDDWGDPSKYNLTLERVDGNGPTTYQVTPSPNREALTDEQLADTKKIDIEKAFKNSIPLAQVVAGKSIPNPSDGDGPTSDGDDLKVPLNIEDTPF